MATSADPYRLSFGANDALDLSLNLPIVLLPPSSGAPRDHESDDGDHDELPASWGKVPTIDERQSDTEDDDRKASSEIFGSRTDASGEFEDPDTDAERTPTTVRVPHIPERNMRRTNKKPPLAANSTVPLHPIHSMQAAFAESLLEVTDGKPAEKPKIRFGDAKARREELISQERDEELLSAQWRFRPGQQQHELMKLMSQISFGVYLLLNGMANSASQVVNILQGHIDEVDEFLEVTMEDFQQASADLKERIGYLRLPMENLEVFEKLLEDRNFRLQIVEGNEKIEHILARTNMQLEQYDQDIQQGLSSAREFAVYLSQQKDGSWRQDRPDVADIYEAMKGNTEGWFNAFADLQAQGKDLNALVVDLSQMVAEMSSKAGEVSRRTWASIPPFTIPLSETPASEASPKSPQSSMQSSRSGRQSTRRASSLVGSAPSSSQSNAQPTYFNIPIAKHEASTLPHQPTKSLTPKLSLNTVGTLSSDTGSHHSDLDAQLDAGPVVDDAPLYILQPRTYTPQPPEPLPSPMVREPPQLAKEPEQGLSKKTSLRQRVSMKTTPPESIHIPRPHRADFQRPPQATRTHQSPDSAYGSDDQQRPRYGTIHELSPPALPPVVASPRSEHHQFYRPVQASPHSPLQQRPLTAGASPRTPYSSQQPDYRPGHQRNAPSRMGGASMLSNVTTMTYDSQASGTTQKLKKKRSAFGWLKKAFSLDEEERMAYEARKQQTLQNPYYDARSPKYVDGKRVR
ncbi:hypothetical protein HYQ44_008713 [Verticillium longisporum]|nr:hypothetical protein HYQ44_008713 [Verticillium longisporum]